MQQVAKVIEAICGAGVARRVMEEEWLTRVCLGGGSEAWKEKFFASSMMRARRRTVVVMQHLVFVVDVVQM